MSPRLIWAREKNMSKIWTILWSVSSCSCFFFWVVVSILFICCFGARFLFLPQHCTCRCVHYFIPPHRTRARNGLWLACKESKQRSSDRYHIGPALSRAKSFSDTHTAGGSFGRRTTTFLQVIHGGIIVITGFAIKLYNFPTLPIDDWKWF